MALLFTSPRLVPTDAFGGLVPGGSVEFYVTQTSEPKTVYADAALTIPLGPVVMVNDDGSLRPIYLDDRGGDYKVLIKDANGSVVPNGTIDPYPVSLSREQVGRALYPRSELETSAGVVPVNYNYPIYNVLRYGAVPDGVTDSSAAVQKAVNALPATGGAIYFPAGDYVIASTIDLAGRRSVRIYGDSKPTAGSAAATLIRTTQTSGDRVFDCRSTYGVSFDSLMIAHFGTGFTGHVIDYGWSDLSLDSALSYVRDCYIQATSTVASLINLHKTHSIEIDSCHLVGGICALSGGGSDYANRILVRNCEFKNQILAPIVNPGNITQVWEVVGNTFEPNSAGGAAAVYTTSRLTNLIFKANWCGDANSTGYWIDAGAMDCCEIRGNFFSTGAGAIKVGAFNSQSNEIKTNTFSSIPIALNIDDALAFTGEFLTNFFYSVSTPIVGTGKFTAGKYQVANGGTIQHLAPLVLTNAYPNGVGGTISGCVWAINTGGVGNHGVIVRGYPGQTAYLALMQDSAGDNLWGISPSGHQSMTAASDPAAPAAGNAILFARLNAGKMELAARFPTGAIQVIASEP